jgi:flagellar biosynthetic protein FlhB
MGPGVGRDLMRVMARGLHLSRDAAFDTGALSLQLASLGVDALIVSAPLLGVLAFAAAAGSVAVGGWMFSPAAFGFDAGRIDPMRGLANLFSASSWIELVKALAKALFVGGTAWLVFDAARADLSVIGLSAPDAGSLSAGRTLIWSFVVVAAPLAVLAAIDVPLVLWRHGHGLRMSREELRQESRETEGDPHIKARVRSLQREAARKRMMAEVPKADVVVTNPTHFAVALVYKNGMRAPRVVAKGAEIIALKIRELAKEHSVPVLEAPPLARALYRHAEIGDEVPAGLYDAIARVLAWVYQLRRWRAEGGVAPRDPGTIDVPAELAVVEDRA